VYAPIKRYLKRNGTAAVIGIGGLGHLAVQYASKLGMRVTAFTSTPEKKDFLYQLGAADASSSVDLVSLKAEQGKYDFVINTLHVNDKNIVQVGFK
jgi:D-arabinose 1-dehydrogenase-like Zn-dependent alcohol dehydrogenase